MCAEYPDDEHCRNDHHNTQEKGICRPIKGLEAAPKSKNSTPYYLYAFTGLVIFGTPLVVPQKVEPLTTTPLS
jgi:hypothetical protein